MVKKPSDCYMISCFFYRLPSCFIFVAVYFLVLSLVNDVIATSKRCVKLFAIIFILEILFLFLYCFTYVLIDKVPIKYITIRHHVR